MCGIAGELSFAERGSDADWERIATLMARRGPDDAGRWSSVDGRCTLVFRRLAILDLSPAGHQPMISADGRSALVFNGEIYNYRELRADLEHRGVRFNSSGDAEVVLQSLAVWGSAALSRFNGIFAIAFYDSRERRLLLARDHVGIKPLYVALTPAGAAFASQYDQIIAHPWSRKLGISPDALGLYLRLAFIPAPYAMLQNTHMLEPGTWLEARADGNIRRGRFFDIPQFSTPTLRGQEAVDAVDAAVTNAVRRQLVSDVPVGAFLSGGIDSPLVVAKMQSVSALPVAAFTIGTADPRTDETSDAAAYAKDIGVAHTIERVTADQARSLVDDVIGACGEPFGDYSVIPTMLVSRLAASQFKVVLSGDGGDELFWGYVRRMSMLIEAAPGFRVPYPLRMGAAHARALLRRGGAEYLRWPSIGHMQVWNHSHLPPALLPQVFPGLPAWPSDYSAFEQRSSDADEVAQWLRWNELICHLTMVLLKVDRASMHHSLEVRVPLLDREVIATAMNVDWRDCLDVQAGVGKLPLRKVLARSVRHHTSAKRGFEVPMAHWLRTSLRDLFESTVMSRNGIAGLEFDRKRLRGLFDQHLSGKHDFAWGLWPLLSLALWEERHLRGAR